MRDGKITDDHLVGLPYEEDLKTFSQSDLGKAIIAGDSEAIDYIHKSDLPLIFKV